MYRNHWLLCSVYETCRRPCTVTIVHSPFLDAKSLKPCQEIPRFYCSLPCLQKPITASYHKPNQISSTPYKISFSSKIHSLVPFIHVVCFPFRFLDRNFVCNSHIITLILFSLVHTKYDSRIIQFLLSSDPRLSRDQVSYPYINYISD